MQKRKWGKGACYGLLLLGGQATCLAADVTSDDIALIDEELSAIRESRERETKVTGYVDAEYVNDTRDGTFHGFRMHHFSLFFTKRFNDDWRFFSEIEFEDGVKHESGTTEGKIFVEAVNVDYQWRAGQFARIGRFFTPAGIWSIDHYPPFVPTQERPMHIRNIFPQIVDGVDAFGTLPVGDHFLKYDLYLVNGDGTPGSGDDNDQKAVGARASLLLSGFKYLEVGVSGFRDTNTSGASLTEKTAYGLHGKWKTGPVTLQGEYAAATLDPQSGASIDKLGYYLQGMYDINQWTVGYRYDFWDEQESAAKDETRNSVFVNYHVTPNIVWKLEHHIIDDEDVSKVDYEKTILSIAYYLGD